LSETNFLSTFLKPKQNRKNEGKKNHLNLFHRLYRSLRLKID